jgi:hypothetical protein
VCVSVELAQIGEDTTAARAFYIYSIIHPCIYNSQRRCAGRVDAVGGLMDTTEVRDSGQGPEYA